MDNEIRFHEIFTLEDPYYDDWLDLYQSAFPINEQMQVSSHNRILRQKMHGEAGNERLLAVIDADEKLIGMSRYTHEPKCKVVSLWYLAIHNTARNQGVGSRFYNEIVRRIKEDWPESIAMILEVQNPAITLDPNERAFARRRIEFYWRNGAHLLGGIYYVQSTGWQEPLPMHLMAHSIQGELAPGEAVSLAKCLFGAALKEIDEPEYLSHLPHAN